MYLAWIALFSYLVLLWGGWIECPIARRGGRIGTTGLCLILGATAILPRMEQGAASIYPASLLTAAVMIGSQRTAHPIRLLVYTLAAGLAGWKLTDWFPMFGEPGILIILPAVLLCMTFSEDRGGKRLLLALSPLVALGCSALSDRFLFGYAMWQIGNAEAFSATAFGSLLLAVWETAYVKISAGKPVPWALWHHVPKENSEI